MKMLLMPALNIRHFEDEQFDELVFRGNQIVALSRPSGPGRCCHRLPLSPRWYPALREIWGIAWGERLEKQPVLPDLLYGYMKGEDTTIIWVECVNMMIQTRVRTELPFSDRPLQDRWSSWSGREVGGKPDGIVIMILVIFTTILIIIVIIIIILVFITMLIMIVIIIITLLSSPSSQVLCDNEESISIYSVFAAFPSDTIHYANLALCWSLYEWNLQKKWGVAEERHE